MRLGLLSGVSLWALKSFRVLAGNGAERNTVSQEPKSAWVSCLVCSLLDQSVYHLSIHLSIYVYVHIYIPSSLKLQHHKEWVAEPNGTDLKGGKDLALVFKKKKPQQ